MNACDDETIPQTYPDITGESWLSSCELAKLIGLIPDQGTFLEIGSFDGASASYVAKQRPEARIVSIDPYLDEPERLATWKNNQRPNQHLWLAEIDTFHQFCDWKFDVILVDGAHRFTSVFRDLIYARLLLKPDGVLTAHDYGDIHWFQVKIAVDRYLVSHPEFELSEQVKSLTCMRRKP